MTPWPLQVSYTYGAKAVPVREPQDGLLAIGHVGRERKRRRA